MTKDRNMIDAVIEIDRRRCEAICKGDVESLRNMLSDNLVYIHGNGLTEGKAEYVERISAGRARYGRIDVEYLTQQVRGTNAILVGNVTMEIDTAENRLKIQNRFLALWVNEDGWQLAAWASTTMPSKT